MHSIFCYQKIKGANSTKFAIQIISKYFTNKKSWPSLEHVRKELLIFVTLNCTNVIPQFIYQFIKISNLKNGIDPSRSEDPLNHLIKQKCGTNLWSLNSNQKHNAPDIIMNASTLSQAKREIQKYCTSLEQKKTKTKVFLHKSTFY